MQLVAAHFYQEGNYIFGKDRTGTPHGMFCWSAEQVTSIAEDWRFTDKETDHLVKALIRTNIPVRSKDEPTPVIGIGATLIHKKFQTLAEIREIANPQSCVSIKPSRIYATALPDSFQKREAAIVLYTTQDNIPMLAHVRTQDQVAELFRWEDWMNEDPQRSNILHMIRTLPRIDQRFQPTVVIHGEIIKQLIVGHELYRSFFPPHAVLN